MSSSNHILGEPFHRSMQRRAGRQSTGSIVLLSIGAEFGHQLGMQWKPVVELTEAEKSLISGLGARSSFYVFLRKVRHQLFDAPMQRELDTMFLPKPRGNKPVPAAQLAMLSLLQAYTSTSDDDAIEECMANDRWKLALGTLGSKAPPCSKKTLVFFRSRMVKHGMFQKLLAKTVELAGETKLFDPKKVGKLRLAIDSAPLRGAGRVEDSINLIAHAVRNFLIAMAAWMGASWSDLARDADLHLLKPEQSVKAVLDLDWNQPEARDEALRRIIDDAHQAMAWVMTNHADLVELAGLQGALALVHRVIEQDAERSPKGFVLKQGVAPERIISISDVDMRHGRKSSSQVINGYKRYNSIDLDSRLIIAACALPANRPESEGADKMAPTIQSVGSISELHVDRAFLASQLVVGLEADGIPIIAKPYHMLNPGHFEKTNFQIDMDKLEVKCPVGETAEIDGRVARFQTATCAACPLRSQCQSSSARQGRMITVRTNEPLLQELRERVRTPLGREQLRERVKIEHSLAHLCASQGPRARYQGEQKNDADLARHATVSNLFVLQRHMLNNKPGLLRAA
jgi:hypothetical protein